MGRTGLLGPSTYSSRWARERKRSPVIAAIPLGGTVSREFDGVLHVATNCEGHWLYKEQKYPTLYAIVAEIAGVKEYDRADGRDKRSMSNWSAARFFRLKERAGEK